MTFNSLKIKKRLLGFALVMFVVQGVIHFSGYDYLYRAVWFNFSGIDDYKIFENDTISASEEPLRLASLSSEEWERKFTVLETGLVETETVAFLVVQNDTVRIEHYWGEYSDSSISNSFSMAKSYVSTLVGASLYKGEIKSLDEPVANYVDHFKQGKLSQVTIRDVLQMSSGTNWYESYKNPFSITTRAYYGRDLEEVLSMMEYGGEPNQRFKYLSGDTQILAFVLEGATGKKLSQLAEERIWGPLGMEHDALWSLDKEQGHEKAYCCISSNARDFSKLGLMYLNGGEYNGTRVLTKAYTDLATGPAEYETGVCDYYGYQWWRLPKYDDVYYARGIHGQYIIVVPSENMVVVRLGHKRKGKSDGVHPDEIYEMLEALM